MEELEVYEAIEENNGKQFRMSTMGRGIHTSSIHFLVQWAIFCLLINNVNTDIFYYSILVRFYHWKKPTLAKQERQALTSYWKKNCRNNSGNYLVQMHFTALISQGPSINIKHCTSHYHHNAIFSTSMIWCHIQLFLIPILSCIM